MHPVAPLVLLSGFGPFERVERNPSAEIARKLAEEPPPGLEVCWGELPVSFDRAPPAWDELLASLRPRMPDLFLGLGVQRKPGFRVERRARARLNGEDRVDVDGLVAARCALPDGPDLETGVDLVALVEELAAEGVDDLWLSEDAGGYVCERLYHHLLSRAGTLGRPAVFLHTPPRRDVPLPRQVEVVGRLLDRLTL